MIEQAFRSKRVAQRLRNSPLGSGFDDFVGYLVERGHPVSTIQAYVQAAEHFTNWLRRTHREIDAVNSAVVQQFLFRHLPRCRCSAPRSRTVKQVRSSLRHLLFVLIETGRAMPEVTSAASPTEILIEGFVAHMRNVQGAAFATRTSSVRYAREFMADQFHRGKPDFSRVKSSSIVSFFASRAERWTPGSMKVAASCLRRFFRYLQVIGLTDTRLVHAVPRIAGWRLSTIPRALTDSQVEALLQSFDRSTAVGQRDYASTICLARLGLRACEVSALTLDDVHWRLGTITVPATKSRRADTLPLPVEVARAILAYLRHGRPKVRTRQLFVRHATPAGSTGPEIIRVATAKAGKLAGISDGPVSPNVLRHTMATRLLRSGATMKEVADVLRHRSIDTAAIYAKVDVSMLRAVAAPWPGRTE
jgi:integrase/recombinase XerD